ncbi:hypothetical protein EG68_10369 [Paragonimus skrjabini miyazakii]|uniref:Uncharacterized protein n=1 Tax=Paragonimus skrjabini miyazakii TaxID=59628 RepID=A0A8S9YLY1_9TREM|nr:hypothetical protein EG68_10369 [Paragonimus skrjabini miyazakii]
MPDGMCATDWPQGRFRKCRLAGEGSCGLKIKAGELHPHSNRQHVLPAGIVDKTFLCLISSATAAICFVRLRRRLLPTLPGRWNMWNRKGCFVCSHPLTEILID